MKSLNKKQTIILGSSLAGALVLVLAITALTQPSNRFAKPVDLQWDTYDLANVTDNDSSNFMEYYNGTVHLGDRSYAIGGIEQNDNILPVIRQLDDTGALIEDYYFGLDTLTMDDNSFVGHVLQLRDWPAQDTMLIFVQISPRYLENGVVKPLTGPLGELLDSEAEYGTYLRLVLTWNPSNDDLDLLYVAGERTEANPYYDLYDVIPEEDTILLGFNYVADSHTLDFEFENPRPEGDGNDYILQRFQYDKTESTITAIEGEHWIIASEFNESIYLNVGKDLYREVAIVDGYLSLSIRANLNNGVELDAYQTWKNDFDIVGFNPTLLRDIKMMFDDQFANVLEGEDFYYPQLDVVVLIDTTTLEVVDFVLEVDEPFAAKIYQGNLYQSGESIYLVYSVRFYGNNPITQTTIDGYKTELFAFVDGQLTLMESFVEEFGFYANGAILTKTAIIFYGYQIWGSTLEEFPDGEVKLLRYELAEGDTDDYVINSSNFDYAFDARVNHTDGTIDFYAYVAEADEDFATLTNVTGGYMTVKISFPIEG